MQYILLAKRDKSFVEILAYSKLQDNNISKRNVSTKDLNLTFEIIPEKPSSGVILTSSPEISGKRFNTQLDAN